MNANVTATMARGYEPFAPLLNTCAGTLHLCGAGPSLGETWQRIPEGADVLAVNSAIGFLLSHDRAPKWAMIWDASELCAQFAVPDTRVTYLIAARCHPFVFARLAKSKVVVWHAAGDHNIRDFLNARGVNEPLVMGGTAGVTRAIYLAAALGYRAIEIHGADSCYAEDGSTHIRGSLVPEKDMTVEMGGRGFRTTPEWCQQVEEIKLIYPLFTANGFTIQTHGDGFFQHAVAIMEKRFSTLQPLEGVPA